MSRKPQPEADLVYKEFIDRLRTDLPGCTVQHTGWGIVIIPFQSRLVEQPDTTFIRAVRITPSEEGKEKIETVLVECCPSTGQVFSGTLTSVDPRCRQPDVLCDFLMSHKDSLGNWILLFENHAYPLLLSLIRERL